MIQDIVEEVKSLIESYNDDTWQYAEGNAYYKERDGNQIKKSRIHGRILHLTKELDLNAKITLYNTVGSPIHLLQSFNLTKNDFLSDDKIKAKELIHTIFNTSVALKKNDEWCNTALYLSKQKLKTTDSGRMGMTGLFRSFFTIWTQSAGEELQRNPTMMEIAEFGAKQLDGFKLWDHRNNCEFNYIEIIKTLTNLTQKN